MDKHIIGKALIHAGLTTAYIIVIASFLSRAETIFGSAESQDKVIVPVIMLLLLVVSAAITSMLVFGKPIMWYIDGKKKEALSLLGYTLGFLVIVVILAISIL